MSKYIEFVEYKDEFTSKKTKYWQVNNKQSGIQIGSIKWATNFRKYAFHPYDATIYDASCLEEIAKFLKEQTELHYKNLKANRE